MHLRNCANLDLLFPGSLCRWQIERHARFPHFAPPPRLCVPRLSRCPRHVCPDARASCHCAGSGSTFVLVLVSCVSTWSCCMSQMPVPRVSRCRSERPIKTRQTLSAPDAMSHYVRPTFDYMPPPLPIMAESSLFAHSSTP